MLVARSLHRDSTRRPDADASLLAALRCVAVARAPSPHAPCQRCAATPVLSTRIVGRAPGGSRQRTWLGAGLLAVLLLGSPSWADDTWAAPAGSRIEFVGTNLLFTADGVFRRWRVVDFRAVPSALGEGFLEIEIDVASLDTGIERRDEHLRSGDFFDVTRFPTARVRVQEIQRAPDDGYRARFDIRIRDVEQSQQVEFELLGTTPLTVAGELTLKRSNFGMGSPPSRWNPMAVEDEVLVRFHAVLEARP